MLKLSAYFSTTGPSEKYHIEVAPFRKLSVSEKPKSWQLSEKPFFTMAKALDISVAPPCFWGKWIDNNTDWRCNCAARECKGWISEAQIFVTKGGHYCSCCATITESGPPYLSLSTSEILRSSANPEGAYYSTH